MGTALYRLLVIHTLRPDRLLASTHHLIEAEFGSSFMQQDRVIDLGNLVANEVGFLLLKLYNIILLGGCFSSPSVVFNCRL